ncbi:MAG: aspartyl-tRNA synthetase, aspartyl-tRNA synthetase [Candidatus Saccharibacteria bacterium]|nr:aspartyl-tRNA synthetase, aspartyl-tRNA synthetase [Candidatus Saccharibacteria bacterium]
MNRSWITDTVSKVDETVLVKGWVQTRRDHGKLIFIDVRDRSGFAQVVFRANDNPELFEKASTLRSEFVVAITATVQKRGERQINPDLATGTIELLATDMQILNESETPVFEVEKAAETSEELRMQYRYMDLRSERMRNNIGMRHKVIKLIRDELDAQDFWEIETPYLTKGTPEGAREFIVPARLSPGSFYVLPQSPQQFKQLLMIGGTERYFQIARCFRDEDTRGDRQAEFTQMDLEMSFVEQEDVMALNEALLIKIVEKLYPEKRIQQVPFPRIPYAEAMEKYGNDRPDIREDKEDPNLLAFCWVVDFPMFEKTEQGGWTFTHNPFSATRPEFAEDLASKTNLENIIAAQYDIVLNGYEIGGGSIRNHRPAALRSVLEIIGYSPAEIEANFGHVLRAFDFGAPPHGGIAWGLERLVMLLQNEPSIRDVMAFPKTGDSRDLLMGAPSPLSAQALKDAGLTK